MTVSDILIIDDEKDIRDLVSGILEDENFLTRSEGDSKSALNSIKKLTPSLVILDIWLEASEMDGLNLLDKISSEYPNLPVIMISGHGNIEAAVSAIKRGAYDFIEKPFNAERLLMVVKRAIETFTLRSENKLLRQQSGKSDKILGNSNAITSMRQGLEKVFRTGIFETIAKRLCLEFWIACIVGMENSGFPIKITRISINLKTLKN